MRRLTTILAALLAVQAGCDEYDSSLVRPTRSDMVARDDSRRADAGGFFRAIDDRPPPKPDAAAADSSKSGDVAVNLDASQAQPSERDAALPQAGSTSSPARPSADDDDSDAAAPPHPAGSDGGTVACSAPAVSDYCKDIPRLPMAPRIDGQLDCGLKLQRITPVGWNGAGTVPTTSVAVIASGWRDDGLYVYVEVRGSPPAPHPPNARIDCGDAVEVYVDADGMLTGRYDVPGTVQFIVAAPQPTDPSAIEVARYVDAMPAGAPPEQSVATALFEDGYAVELFIGATDLGLSTWALQSGASIGFDVAIDVAGSPTRTASGCTSADNQRGQYFLRVSSALITPCPSARRGEPFCDDRAFCITTVGP